MSYSNKKLQIFILCRNRPEYAQEAVRSFKCQLTKDVELIISDNSTSDDVKNVLNDISTRMNYIRRTPALSAEEHFKAVVSEATADHFILFHDDDRALPAYVEAVLAAIVRFPDAPAIGFNGVKINHRGMRINNSQPLITSGFCGGVKALSAIDLISSYFLPDSFGIAPFPAYVYNRKHINQHMFSHEKGGKYTDVSILLELASKKNIVWVDKLGIEYRQHVYNDSADESIHHRLLLRRYLLKSGWLSLGSKEENFLRFRSWFFWWLQNKKKYNIFNPFQSWRNRVVAFYLLRCIVYYFFASRKIRAWAFRKLGGSS